MSQKKQLSILEFSRLTGIKRENLRFYDRIGLLKPELRGENGYRYYTRRQLSSAYLIGELRLLGVGLEDIRRFSTDRTPQSMLALLDEQESRIQAEIAKLRETSAIMKQYKDMAQEALCHSDGAMVVVERSRERLFLCPPISADLSEDEGELLAYEYAERHGLSLGYPMGILLPKEAITTGQPSASYRYYFKAGIGATAWKPAGLYAVRYGNLQSLDTQALTAPLLRFLQAQNLEVTGDVYGELLLNELSVQDPAQYFSRFEVPVRRI